MITPSPCCSLNVGQGFLPLFGNPRMSQLPQHVIMVLSGGWYNAHTQELEFQPEVCVRYIEGVRACKRVSHL